MKHEYHPKPCGGSSPGKYPFRCVRRASIGEGLDELVEASRIPCREEVLDILRNTSEMGIRNDKVVDSRKLFQYAPLYFTAVFYR